MESSGGLTTLAPSAQRAGRDIPLVYDVENTGAHYPAPDFPEFDRLPIVRALPDPFRFFDGTRSTSFASWERRRNEVRSSIEAWEIGPRPDASDLRISAVYNPPQAADTAGRLIVTIERPSNGKTLTLSSKVWLPEGEGPFPVLIPMTGGPGASVSGPSYGQLASVLSSRPVATIDFVHNQVTASGGGDKTNDPFYQLYPEFSPPGGAEPNDHGQYAAWSWGVSRLIDGLSMATRLPQNPLPINSSRIAVTGCSYAGKMALFAGAFDERIALTIPIESGGGGAPVWRGSQEFEGDREVESLTNTDYRWFSTTRMRQFSQNNVYKLPHDHHQLGAMVAPRALLWTGNTDFRWLANRPNYVSSRAVQHVYETLGIGDRFGFVIDGGHGHCAIPESQAVVIGDFVDRFLLGIDGADTSVRIHPYGEDFDFERWISGWGNDDGDVPGDWNPGNGKFVQYIGSALPVSAGETVRAGFAVSIPSAHPGATVTMAGGSVQLDVIAPDGRSATLTIPFENSLTVSIPANETGWVPAGEAGALDEYIASVTAGLSGTVSRIVFSAVGANVSGGSGDSAGPGLWTDLGVPVSVRFRVDTGTGGASDWSPPLTVANVNPS